MTDSALNTWVDGQTAWLELNRPPVNLLTMSTLELILETMKTLPEQGVRCMVLTGTGEHSFCAGADLSEAKVQADYLQKTKEVQDAVEFCPVPIIAAINGNCMGAGLSLALCCDIRIAADHARFRSPGVRIGTISNLSRMIRLIGESHAKVLALTGRDFYADEALRKGLVAEVMPMSQLRQQAKEMAESIASGAPLAVRGVKELCRAGANVPFADLMQMEREKQLQLNQTRDHRHATESFLKKQKPEFIGE